MKYNILFAVFILIKNCYQENSRVIDWNYLQIIDALLVIEISGERNFQSPQEYLVFPQLVPISRTNLHRVIRAQRN